MQYHGCQLLLSGPITELKGRQLQSPYKSSTRVVVPVTITPLPKLKRMIHTYTPAKNTFNIGIQILSYKITQNLSIADRCNKKLMKCNIRTCRLKKLSKYTFVYRSFKSHFTSSKFYN
jgi:hypothetical protein